MEVNAQQIFFLIGVIAVKMQKATLIYRGSSAPQMKGNHAFQMNPCRGVRLTKKNSKSQKPLITPRRNSLSVFSRVKIEKCSFMILITTNSKPRSSLSGLQGQSLKSNSESQISMRSIYQRKTCRPILQGCPAISTQIC